MIVAWLLVAIAEWAAARGAMRERALVYESSAAPSGFPDDPSWFDAGDDTMLDVPASDRDATRLPPPQPE